MDPVTYDKFTAAVRGKKRKVMETQLPQGLEQLKQGQFVVLNIQPENNADYGLKFLIAEIDSDISHLDTTIPQTPLVVQVWRPTDMMSLNKKFVCWQGSDNKLWKLEIVRENVKAIVNINPRGKKLCAKSVKLITGAHFQKNILHV